MNDLVANAERLLKGAPTQVVVGASLLFIAERAIVGMLVGSSRLLGIFESGLGRGLWNLDRANWLAIALVVGAWVVLATSAAIDQTVIAGAAGIFLTVAVLVENLLFDLPNVVIDLYFAVAPALLLPGVLVGLVALLEAATAGTAPTGMASFGGASFADAPPPSASWTETAVDPAHLIDSSAPAPARDAAWLPDPQGVAELRWWDGSAWTDHTHNS